MPSNSPWSSLILIALMVVAFYFLLIRPQKKRQQAQQKTMEQLVPGTMVLLGSGLFGTVVAAGVKRATLELAPGVEVTVLKQAIARVVAPGDEFDEPEPDLDDEPLDEPSEIVDDSTDGYRADRRGARADGGSTAFGAGGGTGLGDGSSSATDGPSSDSGSSSSSSST